MSLEAVVDGYRLIAATFFVQKTQNHKNYIVILSFYLGIGKIDGVAAPR